MSSAKPMDFGDLDVDLTKLANGRRMWSVTNAIAGYGYMIEQADGSFLVVTAGRQGRERARICPTPAKACAALRKWNHTQIRVSPVPVHNRGLKAFEILRMFPAMRP